MFGHWQFHSILKGQGTKFGHRWNIGGEENCVGSVAPHPYCCAPNSNYSPLELLAKRTHPPSYVFLCLCATPPQTIRLLIKQAIRRILLKMWRANCVQYQIWSEHRMLEANTGSYYFSFSQAQSNRANFEFWQSRRKEVKLINSSKRASLPAHPLTTKHLPQGGEHILGPFLTSHHHPHSLNSMRF